MPATIGAISFPGQDIGAIQSETQDTIVSKDNRIGVAATGEIFFIGQTLDSNGDPVNIPSNEVIKNNVTKVIVEATSATVLPAKTTRKLLEFFNASTSTTIFLAFDGATATTSSFPLLPGSTYAPPNTQGAVSGIVSSGTGDLRINEGT